MYIILNNNNIIIIIIIAGEFRKEIHKRNIICASIPFVSIIICIIIYCFAVSIPLLYNIPVPVFILGELRILGVKTARTDNQRKITRLPLS